MYTKLNFKFNLNMTVFLINKINSLRVILQNVDVTMNLSKNFYLIDCIKIKIQPKICL